MKFIRLFLLLLLLSCEATYALVLEQMVLEKTLGKTLAHKKIGYYIGSFDPLHLGHEDIAQIPIQKGLCDYVLIYPSWGGDDSYKKRIAVSVRLKMLFAVFKDHPRVIVTSLPPQQVQRLLTHVDPKITIDQKPVVKPAFEGTEFIGIIGSDVALGIGIPLSNPIKEKERVQHLNIFMRGLKIPAEYAEHSLGGIMGIPVKSFIVARRKGDDILQFKGKVADRPILKVIRSDKNEDISSTAVKEALKNKQSIASLVSPAILKMIHEQNLYE